MEELKFCKKFNVPKEAYSVINEIVTPLEQKVVVALVKSPFTISDVQQAMQTLFSDEISINIAREFTNNAYCRGIFNMVNKEKSLFEIADFYSRLDIFAISQTDAYNKLPKQITEALDQWYFNAYYDSLDDNLLIRPTKDKVVLVQEVLDFIDAETRQVYLASCDCRALARKCNNPLPVCLSYRNGINTFVDRGHAKAISKEEAKNIVITSEKLGLMHTVNPNGICNCCEDCCYLSRARKKRNSGRFWPQADKIVRFSLDKCIHCGICTRRCLQGVFKKEQTLVVNTNHCVGCGVCVSTCPVGALQMIDSITD